MTDTIDVEVLLAPVPGDSPCGVSLSALPEFAAMEEAARSEEVANMGDWKPENPKTSDWKAVTAIATSALATKSKDLRAVVRLAQALANLQGFDGAAEGLAVSRRLAETYWASLHPLVEDEDDDRRRALFDQIGKRLYDVLSMKPIASDDKLSYTYLDYVVSKETDQLRKRANTKLGGGREATGEEMYQAARQDGRPASEDFQPVLAATPTSTLLSLYTGVKRSSGELAALTVETDKLMKHNEPSFKDLKELLDGVEKLVGTTLRERNIDPDNQAPPDTAHAEGDGDAALPGAGGATGGASGSFSIPVAGATGRAQAIAALRNISQYFKTAEPHSPIPLLLDRAIKWASMPLPQVLVELVEDETALRNIDKLLGIQRENR